MSSGIAEKAHIPIISPKKKETGTISTDEVPSPGERNVHYVNRNADDPLPDCEEEPIPGYDATLMRARATLSSAEEKKLLRRIDWHLIPLLAVMYMLKSVDFTNVQSNLMEYSAGTIADHNLGFLCPSNG